MSRTQWNVVFLVVTFPVAMLLYRFVFGETWGASARLGLAVLLAGLVLAALDWLKGVWAEVRDRGDDAG